MSTGIEIDFRQFDAAMVEYAAASKKTFAESLNRQLGNLAIHAIPLAKKAEAVQIRALTDVEWWPKLIAKLMGARMGGLVGGRVASRAYQSQVAWKKGDAAESKVYAAAAKKLSERIIRRRLGAVTFLKFFFGAMARAITGKRSGGGKEFAGFQVTYRPATDNSLTSFVSVGYDYRTRGDVTARRAMAILADILRRAIPLTVADMQKYIDAKMASNARRVSAK